MITQTLKRNFDQYAILNNKPLTRLNYQWQHSLQSAIQLPKLEKVALWHCRLQWQCARSCVTYTWCKIGTNGKRMICSLLVCHMCIFKLISFRTMGLWIWITFFLYALYIQWYSTLTLYGLQYHYKISNIHRIRLSDISYLSTMIVHLISAPTDPSTEGLRYFFISRTKFVSLNMPADRASLHV